LDHATRPYHCPTCEHTFPGRVAYLEHPCIARVLPYLPTVATAEEPDRELARVLREEVAPAMRRAIDALRPAMDAFMEAMRATAERLAPILESPEYRRYMRARRRSRRNSRALARRTAHR
jgi:hypothetical protein